MPFLATSQKQQALAMVLGVLAAATVSAAPLRIMPVGDSITAGYTDNSATDAQYQANPSGFWTEPFEFGYRKRLYQLLTDAGYDFIFVGESAEPFNHLVTGYGDPTHGGTVSPTFDLRTTTPPQDGHRGYGGARLSGSKALPPVIKGYLNTDDPDLILLMIGINGIAPTSAALLTDMIDDEVLTSNPFTAPDPAKIIIAQITPYAPGVAQTPKNADIIDYNTHIRDTLVPNLVTAGVHATTVDQFDNFLTIPGNPASPTDATLYSNGINHPTNAAYDLMAQTWFEGILAVIPPTLPVLDQTTMLPPFVAGQTIGTFAQPPLPSTEVLTFALVAGAGDNDNGKFAISGNLLQMGAYNFATDPSGTTYSILVEATGAAGGATGQRAFTLTLDNATDTDNASPGAPSVAEVHTTAATQAYAGDASSSDILHGLTGIHDNWNLSNGADPLFLNDGSHGDYGTTPVQGAWTNPARSSTGISSSTYTLPNSLYGWDITGITSIADWTGGAFGNQRYIVGVRKAGEVGFTTIAEVDYQPLANANTTPGGTKVVTTRPSLPLATGVDQIRFTFLATDSFRFQAVYREVDVVGQPSAQPVIPDPRILWIQPPVAPDNTVSFTWLSLPGKTYTVETSTTLGDWETLETDHPSGGITTTFSHDPGSPAPAKGFYRASENP